MITPSHSLTLARLVLAVGAVAFAICTLWGASADPRLAFVQTQVAQVLFHYVATLLAFAALPKRRRNDLALLIAGYAVLVQLAGLIVGREFSLLNLVLAFFGVAGALAPSFIERFREAYRSHPFTPISDIRALDERRRKNARRLAFAPSRKVDPRER